MRTIERQRIARQASAFFMMMDAAMVGIAADVAAARKIAEEIEPDNKSSPPAYWARTRIKKAGFAELRSACVRYGGREVTGKFLDIDREIDDFAWRVSSVQQRISNIPLPVGEHNGLHEKLDRIELQAKDLRESCIALLETTDRLE